MSSEALEEARDLIAQGYHQISRAYRMVARLPDDKTGRQALAEASGRPEWAALLGEASAGDHFLRCYAREHGLCQELSPEVFKAFIELGGGTYGRSGQHLPLEMDERLRLAERELDAMRERCVALETSKQALSCEHKKPLNIAPCILWCPICGAYTDTQLADPWHNPERREVR